MCGVMSLCEPYVCVQICVCMSDSAGCVSCVCELSV